MTSLVLVDATGTLKTLKAKDVTLDSLYKKCGFRVSDDFERRHTWQVALQSPTKYTISLWAKKTGKATFENKYDFPPPVDNELYFGTCALISTNTDGEIIDLTKEIWQKVYEKLFGGFEDLGDEDEYSEDELENVDPSLLTSHGYLKDDFVVSDKDIESESSPGQSPPPPPTPMKGKTTKSKLLKTKDDAKEKHADKAQAKAKAPAKVKAKAKPKTKVVSEPVEEENTEESVSELEEEVYNFSDEE
jgi:hypothetical protein